MRIFELRRPGKLQAWTGNLTGEWNAFVDREESGWFWHRTEWLEYLNDYYPESIAQHTAVTFNGEIRYIVPLIYERGDFLGGGIPLPQPISHWMGGFALDAIGHAVKQFEVMRARRWAVRSCPLVPSQSFACPQEVLSEPKEYLSRVVDLQMERDQLFAGVRKSYQQIIKQGSPFFGMSVGVNAGEWSEQAEDLCRRYQELHQRMLHPKRSLKTYEHQKQWLKEGKALLFASRLGEEPSPNGHPLPVFKPNAFQYFVHYKQKAYYMSGVHDGCGLIRPMWYALGLLKELGIQEVELGWTDYGTTQKEKNIEFFKRGFGGEDRPWCVMEYTKK